MSETMETTKQVKCYYELLVQTTTEKGSYSHTEHNSPLVLFSSARASLYGEQTQLKKGRQQNYYKCDLLKLQGTSMK